jgi:protein O-mannosyl-transferase
MAAKKYPIKPNIQSGKKTLQVKHNPAGMKPVKTPFRGQESVLAAKWYTVPSIIFILCFILYGNTIHNDYALDDDIYTRKNVYVQEGFSHFKDIFTKGSLYGFNKVGEQQYRPLALLNFMVEVQWFGMNPHVNHFFNILLFAITCILLYLLLKRLLYKYNPVIPLAIILLFVFHPIHTEVVANIKSRDEILGLLFGTLSLLFLMRHFENPDGKQYYWSLLAFACAGFSKENYLMFALIVPLVLYFFTECGVKKCIRLSLPYVGLVVFYILVRSFVLTNNTISGKMEIINNCLMAAKSGADQSATEFLMLGKYIYLLLIPYPLSYDYSYNQIPIVSFGNIEAIGSILLYLGLSAYAIWSVKNRFSPTRMEGVNQPVYGFAILFYLIMMFLTSNLVIKIGSSFGERFLYAPSLGFCMVMPFFIAKIFRLNPEDMKWQKKNSYFSVLGVILLIYTCILIPRNRAWANNFTLFSADANTAPNSARAHDALAREYRTQAENAVDPALKQQDYALSLNEFRKAISIYKDADVYYNMGVSFYEAGMEDSALSVYQKAIAENPNYTLAFNNLGVIMFNKKQYDQAINYFEKAYMADTNNPQALMNIGAAYQNEGNNERAMLYYNKVLKKDPNNSGVLSNISRMKKQ